MAEQQQTNKKDLAVDLECDDEFEEFGNEGACVHVPTCLSLLFSPQIPLPLSHAP